MAKRRCLLRNTVAAGGLFSALLVVTREEETNAEKKSHLQIEQRTASSAVFTTDLFPYDLLRRVTACDVDSQASKSNSSVSQHMHAESTKKELRSMYKVRWKRPLGEGGFGMVYLGKEKKTGDLGKNELFINQSSLLGKTQHINLQLVAHTFCCTFHFLSRCQTDLKTIYQRFHF